MASAINSARNASVSIFDLVNKSASTITDTVDSIQKAGDILHNKVRVLHAAQTQNTDQKILAAKERDLMTMVKEHTTFMVELQSDIDKDSDYKKVFDENMKRFTTTVSEPSTSEA